MHPDAISIIIPYIDEHDFLQEAVSSALAQNDVEKEILLVCNAPALSENLKPLYPDNETIHWIHEPQPGSAYARNAGLYAAKGTWIQFLDVDDLLLPEKIKNQQSLKEADVIVSPHLFQFLNGKKEKSKWLGADPWVGLLNSGLGSTSSMLWSRSAVIEVGGWNVAYQSHQEYELLFRLMKAGKKILPLDRADTIVRERVSGSITSNTRPFRSIEGLNLRELMWMYIEENDLSTPQRFDAFRQYLFRQLRGLYKINSRETMEKYREHFSDREFAPDDIGVPGYSFLYKRLGFKGTESMLKIYSKVRNGLLPFLPVNKGK